MQIEAGAVYTHQDMGYNIIVDGYDLQKCVVHYTRCESGIKYSCDLDEFEYYFGGYLT